MRHCIIVLAANKHLWYQRKYTDDMFRKAYKSGRKHRLNDTVILYVVFSIYVYISVICIQCVKLDFIV